MSLSRSSTTQILNLSEKALGGLVGALVLSQGEEANKYAGALGASVGASLGIVALATGALRLSPPVTVNALEANKADEIEKHWQATLSGLVPVLVGGSILLSLTAQDFKQSEAYLENAFLLMTKGFSGMIMGLGLSIYGGFILEATTNQLSKVKQRLFTSSSMQSTNESDKKENQSQVLTRPLL